ncbi:MAG: heavy metal-binding domain-containing protein [Defluviitaleaceae bacterium]|nr:heavy metal-binding domain-containing protein [Defluviitaleaceae bacterium]
MILTTTENIAGKNLQHLGLVLGSVVRTKHIGRDIAASFKSLVGGEIKGYTELMNEARGVATQRMLEHAQQYGADAIICVRYSTCSVMGGASEVMAFGTAVKFV